MKHCSSPLALTLGAVIIVLVIQNYAVTSDLSESFDTALGAADVFLFLLGLLSLGVVRNRSKRRQNCVIEALSSAWIAGAKSRIESRVLTEVEHR